MQVRYIGSTWGIECPTIDGTLEKLRGAGFEGIEMGAPADPGERRAFRRSLREQGMALVAQQWTAGATPGEHAASFEAQYLRNIELEPLLVNSHTGKDFYSLEENIAIFQRAAELEKEFGVPIAHETHRGRALYSTTSALGLLDRIPALRLTADFSHWSCVHESLLEDQEEAVSRAIERTLHIHARVGYPEGPQVPDPRDPAWKDAVEAHFRWWQMIVDHHRKAGSSFVTVTPEFGPPHYMHTLPYSQEPVADLWEVDRAMKELLKTRLTLRP